jgi:hypothetical protein
MVDFVHDLEARHEATPVLTGGDFDADWARAESSGEEAVGGSEEGRPARGRRPQWRAT